MDPNGCFLYVISSCGTVSSSNSIHMKITLAVWRRKPHIVIWSLSAYHRGLCWTIASCFMYRLLDIGHLYKHASILSNVNEASKDLFVSVINRYVTFHRRSSHMQACKVCSKPSWSCMGTHGSTMLAAPLKSGWEEDEAGDWIMVWSTVEGCLVTGAASKQHKNE